YLDGAVGLDAGVVARDRPAVAVDPPERAGRFLGVLVIADRHVGPDGQHPDFARTGVDLAVVVGEDLALVGQSERRRLDGLSGRRYGLADPERLRGREQVDQAHAREVAEQPLLGLRAPHHTRRDDGEEAGEIPAAWAG